MSASSPLRFGAVEIRPRERRVLVAGRDAAVGARAFDVLLVLVEQRERLVPKSELLERVWPNLVVEEANLSVHVAALRKTLGAGAIATIPGRGYRFALAEEGEAPAAVPASVDAPPHASPTESATGPTVDTSAVGGPAEAAHAAERVPAADAAAASVSGSATRSAAHSAIDSAADSAADTSTAPANPLASTFATTRHAAPVARDAAPSDIDPLVGREEEVYDIVGLFAEQRLVSIVGAGGIGKTRLAHAVLQRVREDYVDGVWWVDLASAAAPRDVPRSVARALGAAGLNEDSLTQFAAALAPRSRMLIVLDNCEHLAEGARALVAALLDALPHLRLLLTSRVPLHVTGEQVWRIEALGVPAVGATLADARRCGGFELFERRARAADRRFEVDAVRLPLAIDVCRRLEGHPLALEMAAARVAQIGLAALQEHLDERLKLLRAGHRGRPDRQASLKSLIDWSWSLLEPPARAVLRRIAVFVGSFGLNAAQTVAAADDVDAWDALDGLASLVDHSLVQVLTAAPGSAAADLRYRVPATTRLYAQGRLDEGDAGEAAATRRRHRQAMVDAAREIAALRWTAAEVCTLARHAADEDDLVLAFDGACADGDAAAAAELGHALTLIARQRGAPPASRSQGDVARALLALPSLDARTAALLYDLAAAAQSRPADRAADAAGRIEAWQASADRRGLIEALGELARDFAAAGRSGEARAMLRHLRSELTRDDAATWHLEAAIVEADVAAHVGTNDGPMHASGKPQAWAAAEAALDAALADADTEPAPSARRVHALWCLAELALSDARANPREALAWLERADAATTWSQTGRSDMMADVAARTATHAAAIWHLRCAASVIAGDAAAARSAAAEALPLLSARQHAATLFDALAWLAGRAGHMAVGARLLEHADRWYQEHRERRRVETRLRGLALQALAGAPPSTAATARAADAAQAEALARELLGLS